MLMLAGRDVRPRPQLDHTRLAVEARIAVDVDGAQSGVRASGTVSLTGVALGPAADAAHTFRSPGEPLCRDACGNRVAHALELLGAEIVAHDQSVDTCVERPNRRFL